MSGESQNASRLHSLEKMLVKFRKSLRKKTNRQRWKIAKPKQKVS